jgi:hypothetical protein
MPVGKQDHSGIPVAVAIVTGCLHQPLDLLLGEILPHTVLRIGPPTASKLFSFRWLAWSRPRWDSLVNSHQSIDN